MPGTAPFPASRRDAILARYGVLDGTHVSLFDETVRRAADVCDAPMAALGVIDSEFEHYVACVGAPLESVSRQESFGEEVLRSGEVSVIEDTGSDQRAKSIRLVTGEPHVAAWAAAPLVTRDGFIVGALQVMDHTARHFQEKQLEQLKKLASDAIGALESQRPEHDGDASSGEIEYRLIFEAMPGIWWIADPRSHRLVAVSDEVLQMSGRPRGDLLGKHFTEAFPTDMSDPEAREGSAILQASLERVSALKRRDQLPLLTYPIPSSDAAGDYETRYWAGTNTPVVDADGELRYIIHRTEDVTELIERHREGMRPRSDRTGHIDSGIANREKNVLERSQSQNRLNEHLRMAQRVAGIGSWELHLDDNRRIWSDEMYHILGVTTKGIEESLDAILECVHPDDRQLLLEARKEALQGNGPMELEHRIVRPGGEVRVVRERATISRDEKGEPDVLFGTLQDVTEQKRAREEIETRARQQAAVAHLGQQTLGMDNLQDLHDEAVKLVAETLGVEYCKVLEYLPEESCVKLVSGVGWREGLVGHARLDIGRDSQAGYTLLSDKPVVVDDLRTEKRFSGPRLLEEHGVISGMSVVIAGKNGPWGVLGAHTKEHRHFTGDDVNFFLTVANIIAEATQRTAAFNAIRENERRTRSIIDSALDAVVSIDVDSIITDWNPQAERIFGWSNEEALGRPLYELVIPERFRDMHLKGIAEFIRTGEGKMLNRRVEVCALHRDGHEFPVELAISPLRLGEQLTFSGFVRDITEQKRNEAALLESEERFRMVSMATADTIWDWNLLTDMVWWNEGLRKVFGYRPEEIEPDSMSFIRRIHSPDSERVLSIVRDAIDGNESEWQAEYGFVRSDGSVADVDVRGFIMRDESGKATRMVGSMNDVTEKREYERRLEQQAALLDKAQDAIIVKGIDDRITFWNKSAEEMYGWRAGDALGRTKIDLLKPSPEAYRKAMETLIERGEWAGQLVMHRRDNSTLTVSSAWSLVSDDDGVPQAVLCIDTDITERLELEEQLRQSQRLEAVGQLTGGVAHDFNNLLTVILGNSEMMVDQLPEGERLHKLAYMTQTAAQRGAELTHRLLAFARRQALEPDVIDANRLLREMEPLLRRTLPETIDIELAPRERVWKCYADAAQLEAVILNLALNAKDAMPEGGRLTIETANVRLDGDYAAHNAEVSPGNYVLIAVSDTGAGISEENVERAFDPFFTTKEKGKGTGLGLSMAYGFAKQSHGHIKIYSEPGQGTTVKLYLPRSRRKDDNAEEPALREADVGGSEKILVVEDDDLVRAHAERQLEEFGYDVLTATNGAEALDMLEREEDIDLLFTDVIMSGGMNGRDLAEAARKLRPRLRVLYTSGYTENAIVHQGRLDEGVNLLPKPYRRADLARKVRGVLSGPPANQPGEAR